MIEVTCGACGSTHRFAEADVPAGGKTVTCAKCKARIAIPPRGMPAIPAPRAAGGTGDVIDLADLPAPKRPSPLAAARPPLPKPPPITPPPKPGAARTPPPRPAPPLEMDSIALDLADLPAPVGPASSRTADLPAPKRAADLPAAKRAAAAVDSSLDLPAPKRKPNDNAEIADLPAPKARRDLADLPAPKRAAAAPIGLEDLPAPKARRDLADLPAPKGPSPAPSGDIDLPAPKGFFDDLPAPKSGSPAGGGGTEDSVDLPAPKGFFDDLPAPKSGSPAGSGIDLPAPKGFFDDLPGPKVDTADLPAPKGFFDDLPAPGTSPLSTPTSPPGRSKGLDLDDLDLAPPTQPPVRGAVPPAGIAPPAASRPTPLELSAEVAPLELEGPQDRFNELDLPAGPTIEPRGGPAPASGGVVSFKTPAAEPLSFATPAPSGGALDLDVDESRRPAKPVARSAAAAAAEVAQAEPRRSAAQDAARPAPGKRRTMILAGGLAAVALAGGGFFYLKHRRAQEDAAAQVGGALDSARANLKSDKPRHWQLAATAAEEVLEKNGKHPEALAIAAEGHLAGFLEEGTDQKKRLTRAKAHVDVMREINAKGAHAEKSYALYELASGRAAEAAKDLAELAAAHPRDADVALFLGWAQAGARQWKDAIASFTRAAETKERKVPAGYGLGMAHLALGDAAAARAAFAAVLQLDAKHVGARIGAAATEGGDFTRREKALLQELEAEGADKADPRALALGWTLAGDDARRAGRLDTARARYRKAGGFQEKYLPAMVGQAEVDLAEEHLDAAATALAEAETLDPTDPQVNLALADLALRKEDLAQVEARLAAIEDAPLPPVDRARAHMLDGRRLEAQGQLESAATAYHAAQQAVQETDIAPTVARAAVLGKLADSLDATDPAKAKEHREQAAQLLAALKSKADADPITALVLGRAYLATGDGSAAQLYFEKAMAARPDDVEIRLQLVQALELQGKQAEAVKAMRAAFERAPDRVDVGLQLARTYEQAGHNDDARAMYEKLLAATDVSIDLRVRAGLFFVRIGDAAAAAAQGDAIAAKEPQNQDGQFLRAEGLYAAGKHEEARKLYKEAAARDAPALYLDGLGRAAEQVGLASGDGTFLDEALIAYQQATGKDPSMLSPQIGRARLHLHRGEYAKALEAFESARALPGAADHPDIAYGTGVAYQEEGDVENAIVWLARAVAKRPSAEAYLRLGKAYIDPGRARIDKGKAADAYRRATALALEAERRGEPAPLWLLDALWQHGQLERDTGDERSACKAWALYLQRNPTDKAKVQAVRVAMDGMRC